MQPAQPNPSENPANAQPPQTQDARAQLIVAKMQEGRHKLSIIKDLTAGGMSEVEANALYDKVYADVAALIKQEEFSVAALAPAMTGGLAAAVVAGVVWGLIGIYTHYEIGYVALGVGFLAGFAVSKLAGGKAGIPLQVIAAACAVLGILIGKYGMFYGAVKNVVSDEYGEEAAAELSVFSSDIMSTFFENFSEIVSGFDLLWVALAVYMAWQIPKKSGLKIPGLNA